MKKLKTLFSVILAFALMVVIALPVRATESTHTLTIEGTKIRHTYEAYQIFSGTLSTEGATAGVLSNIDWGTGVNGTALLEALQAETGFGEGANILFSACKNAEDVAKVLNIEYGEGGAHSAINDVLVLKTMYFKLKKMGC